MVLRRHRGHHRRRHRAGYRRRRARRGRHGRPGRRGRHGPRRTGPAGTACSSGWAGDRRAAGQRTRRDAGRRPSRRADRGRRARGRRRDGDRRSRPGLRLARRPGWPGTGPWVRAGGVEPMPVAVELNGLLPGLGPGRGAPGRGAPGRGAPGRGAPDGAYAARTAAFPGPGRLALALAGAGLGRPGRRADLAAGAGLATLAAGAARPAGPPAAGAGARGAWGRAWPVPGPRKSVGETGVRGAPGTRGVPGALGSPGPGRDAGDAGTGPGRREVPSAGAAGVPLVSAGVLMLVPSGVPACSVARPSARGAPSGAILGAGAVPGTAALGPPSSREVRPPSCWAVPTAGRPPTAAAAPLRPTGLARGA